MKLFSNALLLLQGNVYPAVVEYAPFQGVPKKRPKKDPKCGTIEKGLSALFITDVV